MTNPKPKLRCWQFSLRALLVFVTLCAILCSWLAVKKQEARRQQKAAEEIGDRGGLVGLSEPSGPQWLRNLLGNDLFFSVELVSLTSMGVTDEDLEHLRGLKQLKCLYLGDNKITDAGLEHLRGLKQLKWLYLNDTKISDAGLERLIGLGQLQLLVLSNTQVTDSGIDKFQKALPNCTIKR
jgi:hypothetical protein